YANRKIGLGVMGWADLLIALGIPYNSERAIALGEKVMAFINNEGHEASMNLARTRGPFPNFAGSLFAQRDMPAIRNATVTTIAPTGTISIIANTSSGIEPLFAVSYVRKVLDNNILVEVHPAFERTAKEMGFYSSDLMERIAEHGTIQDIGEIPAAVRAVFVTAHDITPEDHIRMQAAFQRHTDNAVSKTVNFSNKATIEDVRNVYQLAYAMGCKGVTIYRDGSRDRQVLSTSKSARDQEGDGKKSVRERPTSLKGWTYRMQTGCGPLYVTVNEDEDGLFELFTTMGKAGGCAASQSEAIGRMVSLAWRTGVQPSEVIKQLLDISCHSHSGFGEKKILSCADAVAKAIQNHLTQTGSAEKMQKRALFKGACPDCGGKIEHEGGCAVCHSCGFSECA
ncbi:MAG: TSCPD domain-containing protein, partial [Deltaproteobacteria bacterium]|nr:TSCPD domain-containing protein [Deltaproteobacteria bacterium]